MDRLPVFTDGAGGRFERLVHALVTEGDLIPEVLGAGLLVGQAPGLAHRVAVVRDGPAALTEVTRLFSIGKAEGGIELVLVGGGAARARELQRRVPWFTGAGIWAGHVADDGVLHTPRSGRVGGGWLRQRIRGALSTQPLDWDRFWAHLEAAVGRKRQETRVFASTVRARQPLVTWGLLVAIGVVYGLEWTFGATEYVPAALRMGALSVARVKAGEVWRLASCTFLHGNLLHLLLNGYVLFAIGSSLEVALGSTRFLALYAASAICGSLMSLVFLGDSYSVGASGAILGLISGQAALAWFSKGILPSALQARTRAGVIQNLLINTVNSMRAGVDFGAHAGGAIIGGLLVGLGLLTRGIPRWTEVQEGAEAPPDRVPKLVSAAAILGGLALAAGLLLALGLGGVWRLDEPPTLTRVPLPGENGLPGWTVEAPVGTPLVRQGNPGVLEFAGGDLQLDGVLIDVLIDDRAIAPHQLEAARELVSEALGTAEGGTVSDPVRAEADGTLVGTIRFPSGALLERSARVGEAGVLRTDILVMPGAPPHWRGFAARTVRSIRAASVPGAGG